MAEEDDPDVEAWRSLLVAHSRLVPAMEKDLRAAGQVSLSWYDVLLELNAAPGRRLRMSELGQRAVLSRTRVSRRPGAALSSSSTSYQDRLTWPAARRSASTAGTSRL